MCQMKYESCKLLKAKCNHIYKYEYAIAYSAKSHLVNMIGEMPATSAGRHENVYYSTYTRLLLVLLLSLLVRIIIIQSYS